MTSLRDPHAERVDSPDPSAHALNVYDTEATESEWVDEVDDDDMNFEPTTDESEEMEFFDPAEEDEEEVEFHGTSSIAGPWRTFHIGFV